MRLLQTLIMNFILPFLVVLQAGTVVSAADLENSAWKLLCVDAASASRPRPEIGGNRITRYWLNTLSRRECLYRFRYVVILYSVH